MKAYIDTSVLTGAYCDEPGSTRSQSTLQHFEPVISSLTRLEFSSSVAKKLRMKTFSKTEATLIVSQFHSHLREGIFELTPIRESHYALANEWVDSFVTGLRTLDALHLALAYANQLTLITADTALTKFAKKLGIAVKRI